VTCGLTVLVAGCAVEQAGAIGGDSMTMLIDGHNDLAWAMRQQYNADLDAVDLTSVVPGLRAGSG
jgi:hypothetical protein